MKHIKTLGNFMSEKKEVKKEYEFGCAYLDFDLPDMDALHAEIDEDDLYDPPEDNSFGFVKNCHVTLLYGFHMDETKPKEVLEALKDTQEAIDKLDFEEDSDIFKIHNVSLFENKKFDVLKFDIIQPGKILNKANKKLTKEFEYTNEYPDYHPHVTIAYLKPGKGEKYLKVFEGYEYDIVPTQLVYSENGTKHTLKLGSNTKS